MKYVWRGNNTRPQLVLRKLDKACRACYKAIALLGLTRRVTAVTKFLQEILFNSMFLLNAINWVRHHGRTDDVWEEP